jgi:CRISPR-associated protein Csd1
MILSDLYDLYDLKQETDPNAMPPRHWCPMNVAYELVINADGEVLSCIPLTNDSGKLGLRLVVPMAYVSRSGQKPAPGFLCDDAQHVFGIGENKFRSTLRKMHEDLHKHVLQGVDDEGARAYLSMLEKYPTGALPEPCAEFLSSDPKSNMVFRLLGDSSYLQDRPGIRAAWNHYAESLEQQQESGVCLVTGKIAPRAKLFPQVTGLPGAKSSGAALVSCNADAFCSYGQKVSTAGPISAEAAEKAGAALSYVLKDSRHYVKLGDDFVCFWTNAANPVIDDCLAFYADPDGIDENNSVIAARGEDVSVRDAVQESLRLLAKGKPPITIPPDTQYYMLGIAPYQARLSVRFFETGSLGSLQKNVQLFLNDTEMVGARYCSLREYLAQTAAQGEGKNIPKSLITSSMRALLHGTAFPETLLRDIVMRTRVDHASRKSWDMGTRAAILRACLIRKDRLLGTEQGREKERELTVALNENNTNQGYLLGRLFALLEKVQADAIGSVNAGIRDRYMGAASTTPARVFPQLLRLAQHHISKSEYGARIDRIVAQVMGSVNDQGFPRTLSYDDQGEFYIGYYQQKEALYQKKDAPVSTTSDEKRN